MAALSQSEGKGCNVSQKEGINGLEKKKFLKRKTFFGGEKKKEKNWSPATYFFLLQINYPIQKIIFFKIVRKNVLSNSLEHMHEAVHCAPAFNIYIAFFSGTCLSSTTPDSSPFHQKSCSETKHSCQYSMMEFTHFNLTPY